MICPHCKKPISRTITNKQKQEIKRLRKKGYSLRDIEKLTHVSFSSVSRLLKDLKQ